MMQEFLDMCKRDSEEKDQKSEKVREPSIYEMHYDCRMTTSQFY